MIQMKEASSLDDAERHESSVQFIELFENSNAEPLTVKRLHPYLIAGVDIDYQTDDGFTPLMMAVDGEYFRIAEYLLKAGANPLMLNARKEKASDLAPLNSPIYTLLKQAERLAEIADLPDNERYSILLLDYLSEPVIKIQKIEGYLNSGADINYQNVDGYTALMLAVDAENDRITEYLLSCGSNPLLRNKNGLTARDFASKNSNIYFILKGCELLFLTSKNDINAINVLLSDDVLLVNFRIDNRWPLLIAVKEGHIELVKIFLDFAADLNMLDKNGDNIFSLPANEEILRLLLNKGEANDEASQNSNFSMI